MKIEMQPIGYVKTSADSIPRHWSVSDVEGELVIDKAYETGMQDIETGSKIIVLFCFDRSPEFSDKFLLQTPPHRDRAFGVFSICSPRRPNPIGLSVVQVLEKKGNVLKVLGIDMLNNTPVLDLKPWITGEDNCPSRENR